MLNVFLLIFGFILLIKGADAFVNGASSVAKKIGVPSVVIGMTIVAIGTSLPEAIVSINSSLAGMNDMSIANVVGSNIFNILVGIGVSAFVSNLKISNYKDVFTLLGVSTLLLLSVIDGNLSFLNGIVLLLVFAYFIYNMIKGAKNNKEEVEEQSNKPLWLTIILGILGLGAVVWGGDLVVNSASAIAMQLGMSENLVGLTIVAVGTSLPEFVTSVIATKKGELDMAVGNILGSNIFNILLILGCASVINPMVVSTVALMDVLFMVISVVLFVLVTYKNKTVSNFFSEEKVMIIDRRKMKFSISSLDFFLHF